MFPNRQLVELDSGHPVFHRVYDFPPSFPTMAEHRPPPGRGIFVRGRRTAARNDPPEVRERAFRVGVNVGSCFVTH